VLRQWGLTKDSVATPTRATSILAWLGAAALVAVVASGPAVAKKSKSQKPTEEPIAEVDTSEPMILVVSLGKQKVDVYRGMTLITSSSVSTGVPAHATKAGVFSILEKQRYHHSNIYSGAPMPWMNRITWSGTALHAGVVPGYPASHGCIRLPFSFAPKLFQITTVGDNVVVARNRLAPQAIEHPALFQPLPPPPAPILVKQDQPPERQSSNDSAPVLQLKPTHPGMLARADLAGSATDVPSSLEAEAAKQEAAPTLKVEDPAAVEDTHVHAFDPFAGGSAAASASHAARTESAAKTTGHALDEDDDSSASVSAASLDRPVGKVQPVSTKVEAAPATPPAELVSTTPAPTPSVEESPAAAPSTAPGEAVSASAKTLAEPASVSADLAPAPAAPAAVQAVAITPQTSMAEASATVNAAPPSIVATKAGAGAKAVAIQAAEPRSMAPLRILVTRRTQRDRVIGVQQILADMGYLPQLDFDGTLGKTTASAIKDFQKANGLPETGAFTDDLVKKVYEVAGKGEPPAGHLFVRQEFGKVFDAPVSFKDPETPLGTHLFTALNFAPGATSTRWVAFSLQGDDAASALDRLEIPKDIRQKISERLTPGSSLIIGDTAINSAKLPKGADFLVWAKDTPAKITTVSADSDNSISKPRKKRSRSVRRNYNSYGYHDSRPFTRGNPSWPW
jgi:lipoprotein-anchoring transpeptidase ErfK/SrfK/peptidoglycan hydrolase-like protein with peptidoglycan-binding domain